MSQGAQITVIQGLRVTISISKWNMLEWNIPEFRSIKSVTHLLVVLQSDLNLQKMNKQDVISKFSNSFYNEYIEYCSIYFTISYRNNVNIARPGHQTFSVANHGEGQITKWPQPPPPWSPYATWITESACWSKTERTEECGETSSRECEKVSHLCVISYTGCEDVCFGSVLLHLFNWTYIL